MRGFFRLFVLSLLISSCLLSSCGRDLLYGIDLDTETSPYSEQVLATAEENVYTLLLGIASEKSFVNATLKNKVRTLTARLLSCVKNDPVPEETFAAFLTYLSEQTPALLDAYGTRQTDAASQDVFVALYRRVLSTFGLSTSARIAYSYLCAALSDERDGYDEHVREYYNKDAKLFEYYLQKYDAADADYKALSGIGTDRFVCLCKDGVMIANLLATFPGELPDGLGDFSSEELILLFREMDFDVSLTEAEWEALARRVSGLPGTVGTFLSLLVKNGDVKDVGQAVNDLLSVFDSFQSHVSADTVSALVDGGEEAVDALLSALSEEECARIKSILSLSLQKTAYTDFLSERPWGTSVSEAEAISWDEFTALPAGERTQRLSGLIKGIFYAETGKH